MAKRKPVETTETNEEPVLLPIAEEPAPAEAPETPAEPQVEQLPSASQVELDHYHEICELTKGVTRAQYAYAEAKAKAASLKKDCELQVKELTDCIRRGPEQQAKLPFPPEGNEDAAEDESWKNDSLDALFDPEQTIRKALAEAGINTVGDLAAYTAEKRLIDIPGIGEGKATKIENRMDEYWAARAEAASESDAIDFVDDDEEGEEEPKR